MSRKLTSLIIIVLTLVTVFVSCKTSPVPETPSQKSDEDSLTLKNDFDTMSEQASISQSAKAVISATEFEKLLSDEERNAVAYYGTEDITVAVNEYTDKTLSVKTTGSLTLNSPVKSVVAESVPKGITLNAKADSLLINGSDITTDVKSDTGSIYIEGKNAVVNVSAVVEKIVTVNSTAVIVNSTENELSVFLANGTKVIVPANSTYSVKTNEITKNS